MQTWRQFLYQYNLPFNASITFHIQNDNVGRVIYESKQLNIKKHDRYVLTSLLNQYTAASCFGVSLSEKLPSSSISIDFNQGLPGGHRENAAKLLNECKRVNAMSEEEFAEYKGLHLSNYPIHFREIGADGIELHHAVSMLVYPDVY